MAMSEKQVAKEFFEMHLPKELLDSLNLEILDLQSGVMELTLKHIFAKDILPFLPDIIDLLKLLEKRGAKNFTETVLTYILDRGEMSNKGTFVEIVKSSFSSDIGDKIMTIAEQFKAEGIKLGIEQGMEKEKQIIAIRLLSEGAETNFVAKITQLSVAVIEHLKKKLH